MKINPKPHKEIKLKKKHPKMKRKCQKTAQTEIKITVRNEIKLTGNNTNWTQINRKIKSN